MKFGKRKFIAIGLVIGISSFFQFTFDAPGNRHLDVLLPRISIGATVSLSGLKVDAVDLEKRAVSLVGAFSAGLVAEEELMVLSGSSSDFAESLMARLAMTSNSRMSIVLDSTEFNLQFGSFSYACCGSDGKVSFSGIQELESLRMISEKVDQDAEALIFLDSPNCTFNNPRQDCSFAEFSGQQIEGLVIVDSSLRNSIFTKSFLDHAIFSESNLSGSSFRGASLKGALFLRTDLSGVDFTGADLEGAIFNESRVVGTIGISPGLRTPINPEVP